MANQSGQANFVNLYTSKAHVFQINPETKNSWLTKADQAIPVSFLASIPADSSSTDEQSCERELKIIGTSLNGETVLDATILPKTTFTPRSVKFGQWIDHTGTVYGLGFEKEDELKEFVDTFQQLQREILRQPAASQNHPLPSSNNASLASQVSTSQANGSQIFGSLNQQHLNNVSETNGRYQAGKGSVSSMQQYSSNTLAHPGHQQMRRQQQQQQQQQAQNISQSNGDLSLNNGNNGRSINNNVDQNSRGQHMFIGQNNGAVNNSITNNNNSLNVSGRASPETENSPSSQSEWQIREQLRYENETLKRALEESSKNAGIWHNELLNLRTNNVKLTQALQESKANVEEWERELLSLRDENKELKLRVLALESANDSENGNEYKKDLQKYKEYVDEVQSQLKRKENEIEELQRSMEELELKAQDSAQNGHHDESTSSSQFIIAAQHKPKLDILSAKLEAKIGELSGIQREFSQLVDKLYH